MTGKIKNIIFINSQYALFDNYPSSFNPATTIAYHLPRAGEVKLLVYNLAGGQLVRTLIDAPQAAQGVFKAIGMARMRLATAWPPAFICTGWKREILRRRRR